jgi:hypothetical protein
MLGMIVAPLRQHEASRGNAPLRQRDPLCRVPAHTLGIETAHGGLRELSWSSTSDLGTRLRFCHGHSLPSQRLNEYRSALDKLFVEWSIESTRQRGRCRH